MKLRSRMFLMALVVMAALAVNLARVASMVPGPIVQLESYIEKSLAVLSDSAERSAVSGQRVMALLAVALSIAGGVGAALLLVSFSRAFGRSLSAFELAIGAWHDRDLASIIGRVASLAGDAEEMREDVLAASTQTASSMEEIAAKLSSIHARIDDVADQLQAESDASTAIERGVASLDERLARQGKALARSSSLAESMRESAARAEAIADKQAAEAARLDELTAAERDRLCQNSAAMVGTAADADRVLASRNSGAAMQHLRELGWRIAGSVKELHESVAGYRTACPTAEPILAEVSAERRR